ncbi:hypothetical protein PYCC9005_003193 [Savitreella phatthalungensis]
MGRERPYHVGGTHRDYVIPLSDTTINAIAGACAGLVSSIATCPLDVVKTRLQAQHSGNIGGSEVRYQGIINSLKTIWAGEGIRGMYRGLGPVLLGYLPTWASYFAIYQNCRQIYSSSAGQSSAVANIGAAMTAGAVSTTLTNPIWVVKTRMMTQSPSHTGGMKYRSTLHAFQRMYAEEGLMTFYKGLGPSLLGIGHVAVQFPLYEQLKLSFGADEQDAHVSTLLLASSMSKVIASTTTYPHEVLRTRMQNQTYPRGDPRNRYRGIAHAARTIFVEEGWRTFYVGMGANMVRTVPASALTLVTFELVSSTMKRALERDDAAESC